MADASFPVWVGGLASNTNEAMLRDIFSKFGPVSNITILKDERGQSKKCGFVSFGSYEVSEAAAIALDSCHVFGQIIETRGPAKLKISRQPLSPPKQEIKDGKVLLDCAYFVEKKKCPFKAGRCPYRHCMEAQARETVCDKWLIDQCRDVECRYRHPVVNILKNDLKESKNDLAITKDLQSRCPSHNAFKCNGECGCEECDTHFLDMEAMEEHIKKGREPVPSGACSGCKAVFFSEAERTKHSCFKSKQQESFIPLYHPKPVKPSCQCSSSKNSTVCTCISCGDKYEHSGDSLSTFEHSPKGVVYEGHKCPNSPSVRNINDSKQDLEPIGVFWDIENCPVPKGKSAVDIVKKIREVFFTNKREAEFMCVCDISKEKKEIIEELNKAQVTVVHINATSKNAADDKLRQSLRRFAQSYPPPATVVLVSGDINFAAELSDLRHRHNLTVICLHNAQAHSALLACAHQSERFDLFTNDLHPVNIQAKEASSAIAELYILNLPVGKDVSQIKTRLHKLSDNCGGKVTSVTGRTAVMKFPNHQSAARAKKRLDKEDVFGSLIEVNHTCTLSKTSLTSSPLRTKNKLQSEKVENKVDMVKEIPDRVPRTMPGSKKEKRKTSDPLVHSAQSSLIRDKLVPRLDSRHHVDVMHQSGQNGQLDEDLEEILCMPPNILLKNSPSATCVSTSGTQSLPINPPCNYGTMWQSPFYQGVVNLPGSQIHAQGIRYPLPLPVIGPQHITASWLANLHNMTILEQQKGGVDIMVNNLDENVSNKELKKKLASVFREHCKVYSVVVQADEGLPLCAFVKVPKLSDAQIAVSKVNNQKIFGTFITASIVTEKEKELYFMSCEVISVLREAPLKWMPLNKFLGVFYERCSHPFDMGVLMMVPDLVSVVGKPGAEAICLSTAGICSVKVLVDPFTFAKEVHILVKHHKGNLIFAHFAALYWLKYGKEIGAGDSGVLLSDALQTVPNVCIKRDVSGKDVVTWAKQGIVNGGVLDKLVELALELEELLKAQQRFRLPLSHLISAYQKWFNRKSPFDPVNYGFLSVKDLLEALPTVVKMEEEGLERYVVLTPKLKMKAFEEEVKILLESQPNCCLPLETFMTAYQSCFGNKCRVADYGSENLVDLIGSVSNVAKLCNDGFNIMIYLIRKDDTEMDAYQNSFKTLSREVIELLSCEGKQLLVSMVMNKYHEHFGKHLKIRECGFTRLEDLLQHVTGVQVNEIDDQMFVSLLADVNIERNLVDLVSIQDGGFVPVSQLPSLYQKHFNKKFTLTTEQLMNTVKNSNKKLQIIGVENDEIICCNERSEKDQQSQALKKLATDLQSLLIRFPGARVSRIALADIYSHHRGHGIKPQKWGCSNLDSLLLAMSDSIEVIGSGDFAAVCLKQEYVLRCLARDLVSLLSVQMGKSILVSNLPKVYEKHFGHALCLEHYGFTKLMDVFNSMCSVIKFPGICEFYSACSKMSFCRNHHLSQVLGDEKKRICLAPLQSFAIEAKQLLTHYEGCISLNRFAPCFQQFYNRPLKAADYGYSRLSEVIAAIPHVTELRGKGPDKMVVLLENTDVLLECIGSKVAHGMDTQTFETFESNEASDTESVIVEEEENADSVEEQGSCQKTTVEDLIVLSGDEMPTPRDWLMAPVPSTVPEPKLYPQLQEHKKQSHIKDLISFTEFDSGLCLAGLYQSTSSESARSEQTPSFMFHGHSASDGQREALSPGLRQLSDVEAEILNTPKNVVNAAVLNQEVNKPCKKIATARPKDKSKKMVNPIKLAVKFSTPDDK